MRPWLLLAGMFAPGAQGFVPAPITWGGLPAKRFVIAPRVAFPGMASFDSKATGAPQALMIWDENARDSSSTMASFTAKSDKTITWDAPGSSSSFCVEATGDTRRDTVIVNRCTGAENQLWNVLPSSHGRMNQIQLDGTSQCLYAASKEGSFNGVPIQLEDCRDVLTESWMVEEPIPFLKQDTSHRSATSSAMDHVLTYLFAMAALGTLGLGAWLWRWPRKCVAAASQRSMSLTTEEGGVCLRTPLTPFRDTSEQEMTPAVAVVSVEPKLYAPKIKIHAPKIKIHRGVSVRVKTADSNQHNQIGIVELVKEVGVGKYWVMVCFDGTSFVEFDIDELEVLDNVKIVDTAKLRRSLSSTVITLPLFASKARLRTPEVAMQVGLAQRLGPLDVTTPIPGRGAAGEEASIHVQGQSLRTWSFPSQDPEQVQVLLRTEGRPLDAAVELWHGPDNTPTVMRVYVEDGYITPFSAVIATPRSPNTIAVRNIGQVEFPLTASVFANNLDVPTPECLSTDVTVQGGAVRTFAFHPDIDTVQVLLRTDGRPLNARIELLQGPTNEKQIIELYNDDGMDRPFFGILNIPGSGSVVRIVNTGPIEFPMSASVVPYSSPP